MSIRRSLFLLAILVVVLPFVAFSRANQAATSSAGPALSNLQLYRIERDTVALTVTALGRLEPDEQVSLSFRTAGRVAEVLVRRDDYVLQGDPLVRLQNNTQSLAYQQALIALDLAELNYADLLEVDEAVIAAAETRVETAEAAYLSAVTAVSGSDLEVAQLSYQAALAAAEQLRAERDRIGGQFGGDSVEWRQANARYGEATFQAEIARLQAQRLRQVSGPQIAVAQQQIEEAQAELERVLAGPQPAEVRAAEIQIEQAQRALDQAATAFSNTELRAPFNGVVSAINTEVGGLVAPGLAAIELTDIDPLRLTVQVDEIDIDEVEVGLPVRVTLDALPDVTIPARVRQVAPVGTPSGGIVSYAVEIELQSNDPRMRVGMTAEATIVIREVADVLAVPNLYIRRERATGNSFVNVLRSDNTVEEVRIETGIQGRETSEVVDGLAVGDLVAIDLGGSGFDFLGGAP